MSDVLDDPHTYWDGVPDHGPVDIDPNLPPEMYSKITATQSYTWVLREVFLSTIKQLPFFAGFNIKRNKRVAIQPEDIPLLGVYILDENLVSDGDNNAGQIDFLNTFRIGFSVVIKNNDDADAEQKLDAAWWAIMNGLWRDQYVTSAWDTWNVHTQIGNPDNTRFEGVVGGTRRHLFGNAGANNEFPIAELQYDTTITYRAEFAPIITDPLNMIVTQTGMGEPPYSDREQVMVVYDFVNPGPPFTGPPPADPFPPFNDSTGPPPDTTGPIISAVSATNITVASATITWTTDEAATSQVEYGVTTGYGLITAIDPALVTVHSVNLAGLAAGTTYNWRVRSKDALGNETVGANNILTTAAQPWWNDFTVSGIAPSVVLDFKDGRYFDGAGDAALASLVGGSPTVTPGSGLLCNSSSIVAIGNLLAALKVPAATVAMVTNGATGSFGGLLGFDGPGDDPMIFNNSPANTLMAFKSAGSVALSTTRTADWTKRVYGASGWNASGRQVILNRVGFASDAAAVVPPSAAAYLGWFTQAGGSGMFGGFIERLVVYAARLNQADCVALTGPWSCTNNSSGYVLFANNADYITPGAVLNYEKTQPWTVMAAFALPQIPGSGNVLFTNVTHVPWTGYEIWIDPNGLVRVRIMSGWDGTPGNPAFFGSGNNNMLDVASSVALTGAGNWHTLAVSYDGSGHGSGVKIYIDGVEDTAATVVTDLLGASIVSPGEFFVGNQLDGGFQLGYLGPFILWNTVKNGSFITAAMAANTRPSVDSDTVLYYNFFEGTGAITADASSNNFTGTLNGATSWLP